MDVDVTKCPGGIEVSILIQPGDIEKGRAALADPHRRESRNETENLIIALIEYGAIGGKT